jgi:hypothetical protein
MGNKRKLKTATKRNLSLLPEQELGAASAEDIEFATPLLHIRENQDGCPIAASPQSRNDAILIPSFFSPIEAKLYTGQAVYGRPHSRPGSVSIVATGTMWRPGCWAAVADMFTYTQNLGIASWLSEIRDARTTIPYTQLGAMIDHACMQALNRGFEYVVLVQTDILPQPDLIMKLLSFELPIVVPLIIDPVSGKGVGGPNNERDTGLKPMRWVPFPLMLIKTSVFNCCNDFFGSQSTEDMTWERFWHYGHRPWQDTHSVLEMATHATRFGNLSYDEQHAWLRSVDERRRQEPDRSGPLDGSKQEYIFKEIYMPWRTPNAGNGVVPKETLERTLEKEGVALAV